MMDPTAGQMLEAKVHPRNYGWVVMGFLWGVNFLIPMVAISIGVMLPTMTEDLGITPVQAGLLGSAWFVGSASLALPSSVWLSRYSPKRVTTLALILGGIATLLQGWAPTFAVLLAARFLFVLAVVSRIQAEVLLIHQWFTPRRVALVISVTVGVFSVGQMAAIGLTPSLMVLLSGWRNLYYALGVALLIGAVLWVIAGRERAPLSSSVTELTRGESPIRVLSRHRFLWLLAVSPAGAALAWGSVITFWPTYALETLPLSLTRVGALMTLFPLGGIAASFLAGPLSDLLRRRKVFIWGPGILLPPLYVALFTVKLPLLAGLLLLASGWNAMVWVPILRTIPFDIRLSPRETAVAQGLIQTLLPLGGVVGPPLVGAIQQLSGSLQVGLLSIVAFPLTLLVGGLLIPETSPYRAVSASKTREEN